MGGEIDITQNTWGALSWNSGQWGDQTDLDLNISGLQLNTSPWRHRGICRQRLGWKYLVSR